MTTNTAFSHWKNTSEFPDAWARPVCDWIASKLDIPDGSKEVIVRNTSRGGHGHAGGRRVVCSIQRRKFRRDWKYVGMAHDNPYKTDTALESFVFLAAHELYHVCPAGRSMYREQKAKGGHWRQAMEFRTQRAAWEVLLAYRAERTRFLTLYRKALRRERDKGERMKIVKAAKNTPEHRLHVAEKHLVKWSKRMEQAERMVRKWKAKVNRTRAAMAVRDRKRMAASPCQ